MSWKEWKERWSKRTEEPERDTAFDEWIKGKSRSELEEIVRYVWSHYRSALPQKALNEVEEIRWRRCSQK